MDKKNLPIADLVVLAQDDVVVAKICRALFARIVVEHSAKLTTIEYILFPDEPTGKELRTQLEDSIRK